MPPDTENFRHAKKRREKPALDLDRLPPHSPEAEAGVLACLLLAPGDCLDEAKTAFRAQEEVFYDLRHRTIYASLLALQAAGKGIDLITLQQHLRDAKQLEGVGGLEYLASLPDKVPSAANFKYYADIVWDKFLARQAIRVCSEAIGSFYEETGEVAGLISTIEKDVLKLSETGVGRKERLAGEELPAIIDELEHYHRGSPQMKGLTTGFEYFDKMLCGLGGENGNMIVLAARPGIGKTSLAMDIAAHVALDAKWWTAKPNADGTLPDPDGKPEWIEHRGLPVGVFSLEMSTKALTRRLMFQRARGDLQRFRTGMATNDAFPALVKAAAEIRHAKLYIDDTPRCTIDELAAKARRMHRQHGIRLFVVDYIQLLRVGGKRFREDRVQELSEISAELYALGKTMNVPFVILAQMNRDYEKDPNRAPRLSDLKDCGAIEQDADFVGFLYKPKLKEDAEEAWETQRTSVYGDDWSKQGERVNLLAAKYRHGPTGKVELVFEKFCTHFVDYVRWKKNHGFAAAAKGERQPDLDNENTTPI